MKIIKNRRFNLLIVKRKTKNNEIDKVNIKIKFFLLVVRVFKFYK